MEVLDLGSRRRPALRIREEPELELAVGKETHLRDTTSPLLLQSSMRAKGSALALGAMGSVLEVEDPDRLKNDPLAMVCTRMHITLRLQSPPSLLITKIRKT